METKQKQKQKQKMATVCICVEDYGDIEVIEKIKKVISKMTGFRYFISPQYVTDEPKYDIYAVGDSAWDMRLDIADDELLMAYIQHLDIKLM